MFGCVEGLELARDLEGVVWGGIVDYYYFPVEVGGCEGAVEEPDEDGQVAAFVVGGEEHGVFCGCGHFLGGKLVRWIEVGGDGPINKRNGGNLFCNARVLRKAEANALRHELALALHKAACRYPRKIDFFILCIR